MTRQIKASEVREGMEIRWEEDGAVIRPPVFEVMTADCGRVSFVPESRTPWHVKRDQVVTVLREPQPDEPTAFGACVEVAGVKYVRVDEHGPAWVSNADYEWNHWAGILDAGHVTVINADPFANTEPREPRVWERWADVPDGVTVRLTGIETPYRKVGGRIECRPAKEWELSVTSERVLNKFSPFTEVLPGA